MGRIDVIKTVKIDPVTEAELEVLASYDYQVDAAGNREEVIDHNGRKVEYKYDELNRVIEEKITNPLDASENGRVITYTYDGVGNLDYKGDTLNGDTDFVYNHLNQLVSSTFAGVETLYTYDDNGSLKTRKTGDKTITYDWENDGENRLVGVEIVEGNERTEIEYEYNENGIRVGKTVDGVETSYLIDELQPYAQVLEEYDALGNLQAAYTYGEDLISRNGQFYHKDGLGSTRLVTDALGGVSESYNYDAYGNLIAGDGSENPYLFAGEQRDVETGLDYLRARYYDPTLGRFISRDAYQGLLNDPMSQHKYQYAHANPVVNTDPSGYATFTQIAAASAFLTTLAGLSYTTGAAGAVLADGGSLGDAVALYDQFFAGYSDALTFGFSTLARRLRYNDTATQNHRGLFFNLGRFGGTLSSTWIGSRAAGFGDLGSASWWARGALGYDLFGAGVGMVQSARSVAETGRITLLDVLAFLPAISWRLSGTEGLGTGIKQTRAFPRRNQPFGPSAKGLEILNDYQLDLHHKLVTSSDLGGIPLQPGEIGFKDIAALTNATGWEHGVIRLQDGTRLIVQGTNEGLTHLPTLDVKRIIVHSHPGELPYHLEPSGLKGDVGYLWTINQRRSYIVTSEAHMEGYDYWLGVFENDGFWRGINTPMEMVVQGVIKDLR